MDFLDSLKLLYKLLRFGFPTLICILSSRLAEIVSSIDDKILATEAGSSGHKIAGSEDVKICRKCLRSKSSINYDAQAADRTNAILLQPGDFSRHDRMTPGNGVVSREVVKDKGKQIACQSEDESSSYETQYSLSSGEESYFSGPSTRYVKRRNSPSSESSYSADDESQGFSEQYQPHSQDTSAGSISTYKTRPRRDYGLKIPGIRIGRLKKLKDKVSAILHHTHHLLGSGKKKACGKLPARNAVKFGNGIKKERKPVRALLKGLWKRTWREKRFGKKVKPLHDNRQGKKRTLLKLNRLLRRKKAKKKLRICYRKKR